MNAAIKLARVGANAVVSIIASDGTEAVIIRERYDDCFSHIVEPEAIENALRRERGFDNLLGDQTP